MKTYGLIVADNGTDMYVTGVHDTRWDNDVLNPAFASLKASDFEVLLLGWQPSAPPPPPPASCVPSGTRLCLGNGRFQVEATWTSGGSSGAGRAEDLTPDTGWFWFFNENNVETMVKVLDACGVNGHFWVFAGGLTNVRVVLRVTDTVRGAVKTYTNPQGTAFQPIQDTGALATCP